MSLDIKVPKLLKRKMVVRNIESVENAEVALQINNCIDLMQEYKPYTYQIQSLRSKLSNWRGQVKLHGAKVLQDSDRYLCNSNLGELLIYYVPSLSTKNEFVELALKELNLEDVDFRIQECDMSSRQIVRINTDALKLLPDVIDRTDKLNEAFHRFVATTTVENNNVTDKFICASLSWIRENIGKHRLYLKNYTLARNLFMKSSKDGNFPRSYDYKGVIFNWQDISTINSLDNRIRNYLTLNDMAMFDKYIVALNKVRADRGERRIMFSLDNFDYDTDDDIDTN
jgi:hypothetical protein